MLRFSFSETGKSPTLGFPPPTRNHSFIDIKGEAVIVLSMIGKNYRLTQDMKDAAAALKLPLAKAALTLRQIYADAPGQAKVVWQMGSRAREATADVEQLFHEILPDAVKHKLGKKTKVRAA